MTSLITASIFVWCVNLSPLYFPRPPHDNIWYWSYDRNWMFVEYEFWRIGMDKRYHIVGDTSGIQLATCVNIH